MSRDRGFTYLGTLFAIAALGASLAATGLVWRTVLQREKEAELLFVGAEFRRAIGRYHAQTPGPAKQYPPSLEALLKDPRFPSTQRYLRRIYPDPMTGRADWGVVQAPEGGIMGIHSLSTARPLKAANFRVEDAALEGAASYADWRFVYQPGVAADPTAGGALAPVPTPSPTPGSVPINAVPPDPLQAPAPLP